MSVEELYTLAEVEETLSNGPNFLLQFDDDECNVIDVVELPSDNMDIISDEEDINEDLLGESVPTDVPVRLHIQEDISNEKIPSEPSPKIVKDMSEDAQDKIALEKKGTRKFFP